MSWNYTPIWILKIDEYRELLARGEVQLAKKLADDWGIPEHIRQQEVSTSPKGVIC